MNATATKQTAFMTGWNAYADLLNKSMKPINDRIEAEQAKMRPQTDAIKKAAKDSKQCITFKVKSNENRI